MLSSLAVLAAACMAPLAAEPEAGHRLVYRGTLAPVKGETAENKKSFEFHVLATDVAAGKARLHWMLSETGRGSRPWADRFGSAQLPLVANAGLGPALLYDREEGAGTVELRWPWRDNSRKLAAGESWSENGLTSRVEEAEKRAGHECWRISVKNAFGVQRVLWADQASAFLVAWRDVVFLGQGVEHSLVAELASRRALNATEVHAQLAGFSALDKLRIDLAYAPRSRTAEWNDEQLRLLKGALPGLRLAITTPPLGELLPAIEADTRDQRGRHVSVAALTEKFMGQPAPKLSLAGTADEKLTSEQLRGQVTVLHIWDYRLTPLEEPYGQVGFVDFLARQEGPPVRVYGVATQAALAEAPTRGAAIAGVKKLKEFMNLSFPVLLDDGSLLKALGDPRGSGAKLPLFVVIGRDGKIAHYHVGVYTTNAERGLTELAAAIRAAVEAK